MNIQYKKEKLNKQRITAYALVVSLLLFLWPSCSQPQPAIIRITEDMVIDESGSGVFMNWFDEQDLNGIPKTRWETYGMTSYWPAGLVIDFQRKYKIESIWIFDAEGSHRVKGGTLQISSGEPFKWDNDSLSVRLQNKGEWIKTDCSFETRFLRIQKHATLVHEEEGYFPENYDLAVTEVILVGYPLDDTPYIVERPAFVPFNVPMDQFIGMNSYINTPDKVHEAVGNVREYRPWRWNGVTDLNTPISWDPIPGLNNPYHPTDGSSDNYYKKMLDMGIECMPCIHRHVDEENYHEYIPDFGGDPADPASYKIMADYSFQFVARYGHHKVPEQMLRTTEPSPKKSGLGYIRYFENWNEGNRWWGNPKGHFTPYQFAAFCSASYDGHMGELGSGMGVKAADPNIRFSFGGLAELSLSYIQAMKLWSDHYRNGSFPADVINVHHYCNTMGKQHSRQDAYGISPEQDGLKEKLEKLVCWRNNNLPGVELWLTEFGWDTDEKTYQSAAFGHKLYPEKITMNEIQGQWLVRAFLIGSAAGFERLQMFLANDLRNYPHGVYGSCGFITIDNEFKPSWYYVKTLKTALTGMLFHDEFDSGNDDVWIYRYRHPETGKGAYVLWCPTADGTVINNYKLRLNNSTQTASLISLLDKMETGSKEELTIENRFVTVNVSERPVIVLVDKI